MKKTILSLCILVGAVIIIGLIMYVRSRNSNSSATNTSSLANDVGTTTADGLLITTMASGAGEGAPAGALVTVNYTGKFENGKAFDSNVDPAFKHVEPFQCVLGGGQVIKGWDEGVLGMKVGEKRHLVIPASLGYGANDYGPIPGNSTLIFDVEMVSFQTK